MGNQATQFTVIPLDENNNLWNSKKIICCGLSLIGFLSEADADNLIKEFWIKSVETFTKVEKLPIKGSYNDDDYRNFLYENYGVVLDWEKFGSGVYGSVFKVQVATGEFLALKEMRPWQSSTHNPFEDTKNYFKREVLNSTAFYGHHGFVQIRDHMIITEPGGHNGRCYIAFELCERNLDECWEWLNDSEDKRLNNLTIFKMVCESVAYMHRRKWAHRDLCLENILLSTIKDGKAIVKLGDFGISRDGQSESMVRKKLNLSTSDSDSYQKDIYDLGLILYKLLSEGDEPPLDYRQRLQWEEESLQILEKQDHSEDLIDLLERMLTSKLDERLTIEGVLKHTWMVRNESSNYSLTEEE